MNEHLKALLDFQKECQTKLRSLAETVNERSDNPRFTEAEQAEWDQLDQWERDAGTEAESVKTRLDRIEKLVDVPGAVESEDEKTRRESVNVNTRTDPFENLERIEELSSEDLRARAQTVIEKHIPRDIDDRFREGATATTDRAKTRRYDADAINAHIITSSSPEYLREFELYVQSFGQTRGPLLNRAAMSLTAANGGVMVPQFLDPTINLTNAGTNNVVRQIVDVVPITVDQWDGVTSAGVTATMLAEGTEASDNTPTFVGPTISVHKAAAYAFASYEVLMDSGFNEIGMLFADAKDRLEESKLTTGTGTNEPFGLITRLSGTGPSLAGSSGAAGAADLVAADVYALVAGVTPRFRRNAVWQANINIWNTVRQFATANNYHAFWTDLGPDTPSTLLGRSVYENEAMDSTIVSGSNDDVILFGDHKQYKLVDRVGMEIVYNPLVVGASNRPTGQAGWFGFWRFGGDVITSNGFRLLRV